MSYFGRNDLDLGSVLMFLTVSWMIISAAAMILHSEALPDGPWWWGLIAVVTGLATPVLVFLLCGIDQPSVPMAVLFGILGAPAIPGALSIIFYNQRKASAGRGFPVD